MPNVRFRRRVLLGGGGAAVPAYQQILTAVTALDANASVYDPDNPNTWTLRSTFYAGIADGMGNRAAMAQATEAQQPDQVTLSNGRRVLARTAGAWRYFPTSVFAAEIAQPNTVMIVSRVLTTGTAQTIHDSNTVGARQFMRQGPNSMFAGTEITGGASTSNFIIQQSNNNGASSELFVDGVSSVAGNAGADGLGGIGLMAPALDLVAALDGTRIGPVIVFSGLQSNAATAALRAILSSEYPPGG